MPRVPHPTPIEIAAPVAEVRRVAIERLEARVVDDGNLLIGPDPGVEAGVSLHLRISGDGDASTTVTPSTTGSVGIPFFAWFFAPFLRVAQRRLRVYAIATLRSVLEGGPEPAPPKSIVVLPPVDFTTEQAALLATAAAAAAMVGFASSLFGQFLHHIGETYNASDTTLGVALAITRAGALMALVVTALADRRGRRWAILVGLIGSAAASAISAVAPTLVVFTLGQVLERGFVITTATVAGIAVIEEAPEGARAYALSMLALAGGLGFSLSVLALPLGGLGSDGWRIPFVLGAATIFLVRVIGRRLVETTRYRALEARVDVARGQVREVVDAMYRRRFLLLGFIAFLTSMFSAPSSQFMNKYLTDTHDFSDANIALFRTVTTAVPGLIGLVIGGRISDRRGRKPVAIIGLTVATVTQMAFFVLGGPSIWVLSAVSVLASGAGGIALGSFDIELFPTEVRSTSSAMLTILAVAGSAIGLVAAGALSDQLGGIGRAVALTGIGTLVAAIFLIPLLPESAAGALEDISPTEEYRPDP
jgi:MFS family permease